MTEIYAEISKLSSFFRNMCYGITQDEEAINDACQEMFLYFLQMNPETLKNIYEKDGLKGIQQKIDQKQLEIVSKQIPTMPTWFERLYGSHQLLVENEELSPFAMLELETILFEKIRDRLDQLLKLQENIPSKQVDQLLSFFHQKKTSNACTFEDPNDA